MLSIKRSATCSTSGGSQGMCITFASTVQIRQNPLWLWNQEETSPEIQKRGTSGPQIGHVNVSDKKPLKNKKQSGSPMHKSIAWNSGNPTAWNLGNPCLSYQDVDTFHTNKQTKKFKYIKLACILNINNINKYLNNNMFSYFSEIWPMPFLTFKFQT